MAGKRQHYIPRLLQRGFLHSASDKAELTWLHRRGFNARLVGIRDVGVEEWFYSRKSYGGKQTLDDVITELEHDLAASVESLRASVPGNSVDGEEAARTIVHLVMRTAHLRRVISDGMTSLTKEIETLFTDPVRLGAMIGLNSPALAAVVSDSIRESALERAPAGIPAAFAERLVAFALRELGDRLIEQAVVMLGPIFPQLYSGLAGKVRDAHNSILATSPESNAWVKALAAFEWTLLAGVDIILPDAVALAREQEGNLMPFLFTRAADVGTVVMPISSDRVLVGQAAGYSRFNLAEFNSQAAASCEAFFIGAKPFDDHKLNALIGSAPANAMKDMISAAVREAETARSMTGLVPVQAKPQTFTQQDFSYSVRLVDFGDEILLKEFADVLQGVVGALSRDLPLHDLDGFTLAHDYHAALATLDRGDPNFPPATSEALRYCSGVAKSVTVIRGGARKEHVVIEAGLAHMWLSPEAENRATGLYMLVKILAGIAHSTRYTSALEATFTPDTMGREFHLAVANAPADYWSARQAALIAPSQAEVYANLVIDSLAFTERLLSEENARIGENGDITSATMRALECATAVIGHAAEWLGHREGLGEDQPSVGSDLPERLRARGLDRWIELFGRDLAACYSPDGALNLEVVAGLSLHVERLFWSFGIYCWPEEDEVRCLVTGRSFVPPQLA